ncbi:hypothetical protein BFP70_06530 [Thioclava sp. SK-1]|nr:hypothetical protein BFP70_06530 [Thioclava sp. SK-1]
MRLTASGLLYRGTNYPAQIGRAGLRHDKCEGDGATPIATLAIIDMLYRADRLAAPQQWARPIGPRDLWCDDVAHTAYNHRVTAPFAASHERLRRPDPLYDIVLITSWNYPDAVPGLGSAIFIHQRRRAGYPTAGCIALRRDHLMYLAQTISRAETIIVPPIAAFAGAGRGPRAALAHDKA